MASITLVLVDIFPGLLHVEELKFVEEFVVVGW